MDLNELNEKFKRSEPEEILEWTVRTFPYQAAMTSSFQASGIVLIHMLRRITFDFPIFFIDTGFHFPETLEFKNRITKEWSLNVHTIIPMMSKRKLEQKVGPFLYEKNPDLCCRINKVSPLENLRTEIDVKNWISAVRKDQSENRKSLKPLMRDRERNLRIHPLVNWTSRKVWAYIHDHSLPYNPLYDQGYSSIGCFPPCCTSKNGLEDDERAGRWSGSLKSECGLHTDLKAEDGRKKTKTSRKG